MSRIAQPADSAGFPKAARPLALWPAHSSKIRRFLVRVTRDEHSGQMLSRIMKVPVEPDARKARYPTLGR